MIKEEHRRKSLKEELIEEPGLRVKIKDRPLMVEHIRNFINGRAGVKTLFKDLSHLEDENSVRFVLNLLYRKAKNNQSLEKLSDLLLELYAKDIVEENYYEFIQSAVLSRLNGGGSKNLIDLTYPGADIMELYNKFTVYEFYFGIPPQRVRALGELIFMEIMNK